MEMQNVFYDVASGPPYGTEEIQDNITVITKVMFCYWLLLFISYSAGRGRKKIWESFLEDIQGRKNLSPKKNRGRHCPIFQSG
jgi:hypothetical protein